MKIQPTATFFLTMTWLVSGSNLNLRGRDRELQQFGVLGIGPAASDSTDAPLSPAPTDAPATPAPTDAPQTPVPTDAPQTPAPTDAPQTPAPTDAPQTPAPTTDAPTEAPVTSTNAGGGLAFTMTNAQAGNEILMFERNIGTGTISFINSFPTDGIGGAAQEEQNDPLASQDSLILTANEQCLIAVNAGSDTITSFTVHSNSLVKVGVYSSGGAFPVSITQYGDRVYVLNAGNDGSIQGYQLLSNCELASILGSRASLGIQDGENPPLFLVAPAQVGFTPDGACIVVLIKGTEYGVILTYPVDSNGMLALSPVRTESEGFTPFAFEFDKNGNMLVAEGFGNATVNPVLVAPTLSAGAVSSYEIDSTTGAVTPITSSEPTAQTATCWVRVHEEAGCAYTTNNGNADSISSLQVDNNGQVTLIESLAAVSNAPLDMSIVDDFLYVLSTGHRDDGQPSIEVYEIFTQDCGIVLIEEVTDNIPHENVTVFGVVGMAAL